MKMFRASAFAVVAAVVLWTAQPKAMILLMASTDSLELVTTSAANIDYTVSYADHTTSTFTPGAAQGTIASATTTTIVSAPAASTQRQIKLITILNRHATTAQGITLQKDVSATDYQLTASVTLATGERMIVDDYGQMKIYDATGAERRRSNDIAGYSGRVFELSKPGTAKDSAGYFVANAKDAGFPGAYALGAPGLNGWNTDCGTASNAANPAGAAQVGSHYLQDPASGSYYLTSANFANTVAEFVELIDPMWYNTALVVTTTTAQTVTMAGALPARDVNGSTNGEGVYAALLTTTANTNAAVISTSSISYTDSEGNAGNTGSFNANVGWQAPATPVIGTFMRFGLAAGDRGIRSVQSVTLATSYGAGALSLVLYRPLASIPNPVASVGGYMLSQQFFTSPGIRLYNDTCLWSLQVGSASAATITGSYTILER